MKNRTNKEIIIKALTDRVNSDLEKGDIELLGGLFEKAKKGEIGEIRIWSGKKFQKQGDGKWIPLKDSSHKNETPQIVSDYHTFSPGDKVVSDYKVQTVESVDDSGRVFLTGNNYSIDPQSVFKYRIHRLRPGSRQLPVGLTEEKIAEDLLSSHEGNMGGLYEMRHRPHGNKITPSSRNGFISGPADFYTGDGFIPLLDEDLENYEKLWDSVKRYDYRKKISHKVFEEKRNKLNSEIKQMGDTHSFEKYYLQKEFLSLYDEEDKVNEKLDRGKKKIMDEIESIYLKTWERYDNQKRETYIEKWIENHPSEAIDHMKRVFLTGDESFDYDEEGNIQEDLMPQRRSYSDLVGGKNSAYSDFQDNYNSGYDTEGSFWTFGYEDGSRIEQEGQEEGEKLPPGEKIKKPSLKDLSYILYHDSAGYDYYWYKDFVGEEQLQESTGWSWEEQGDSWL